MTTRSAQKPSIVKSRLFSSELFDSFSPDVHNFIDKNDVRIALFDDFTDKKDLLTNMKSVCNPVTTTTTTVSSARSTRRNTYQGKTTSVSTRARNISVSYISGIFENLSAQKQYKYDIVFVVNKTAKQPNSDDLIGFLITEVGECDLDKYKNIPVLNLICSRSRSGGITGRLLFFIYLSALLNSTQNYEYGLLELASNYINTGGLCLYNKFGFRDDLSLKSNVCFNNGLDIQSLGRDTSAQITLPMKVELQYVNSTNLQEALILNKAIEIPGQPLDIICSLKNNPIEQTVRINEKIKELKSHVLGLLASGLSHEDVTRITNNIDINGGRRNRNTRKRNKINRRKTMHKKHKK